MITVLFFIVIQIIFFIIFSTFILPYLLSKQKEPYRIVQVSLDNEFNIETLQSIYNCIGKIGIFNTKYVESHLIRKLDPKYKPVFQRTVEPNNDRHTTISNPTYASLLTGKRMPFLTPNIYSLNENNVYFNGFKSLVMKQGDAIHLNNFAKTVDDKQIDWVSDKAFIKDRKVETCFLKNKQVSTELLYRNKLIIMRYLIDNDNAVHINFINNRKFNDKESIKGFIGSLKYIKNFITTNNVKYFSIAGSADFSSVKRNKYAKALFPDNIYISPSVEDKFYQISNEKEVIKENEITDFIIISKSLAPYGVKYYLTEIPFTFNHTKYVLVSEIQTSNIPRNSLYDFTMEICNNMKKKKRLFPNTKMDFIESNNISLEELNTIAAFEYEKLYDNNMVSGSE